MSANPEPHRRDIGDAVMTGGEGHIDLVPNIPEIRIERLRSGKLGWGRRVGWLRAATQQQEQEGTESRVSAQHDSIRIAAISLRVIASSRDIQKKRRRVPALKEYFGVR